jgi:hypothetical protein
MKREISRKGEGGERAFGRTERVGKLEYRAIE